MSLQGARVLVGEHILRPAPWFKRSRSLAARARRAHSQPTLPFPPPNQLCQSGGPLSRTCWPASSTLCAPRRRRCRRSPRPASPRPRARWRRRCRSCPSRRRSRCRAAASCSTHRRRVRSGCGGATCKRTAARPRAAGGRREVAVTHAQLLRACARLQLLAAHTARPSLSPPYTVAAGQRKGVEPHPMVGNRTCSACCSTHTHLKLATHTARPSPSLAPCTTNAVNVGSPIKVTTPVEQTNGQGAFGRRLAGATAAY